MASALELIRYIRFQLSELGAQNKHHIFEDIARHVARLRICENILPATGPVSAGGDQGRDFETYRSYLVNTPLAGSTFLGSGQEKKIVFACSIQKKIPQKIKADLQTICGSDTKIDCIYYFCETNLPVSKRHELQKFAKTQHQIDLEIFDGQSLSEMLVSPDIFWIAVEYLSIPSDMIPQSDASSATYQEYKLKWSDGGLIPHNYADFFQVTYGLRTSTFNKNARPDILFWVKKMEVFLTPDYPGDLRRRAIYEIAVASLRGMNNLTSQKDRIDEYFSAIHDLHENTELEDAVTLLIYCCVAVRNNHFQFDEEKLHSFKKQLIKKIEDLLKVTTVPQRRAYLCMLRGNISTIDVRQPGAFQEIFKWWGRVVAEAKKSVLFPIERFSNLLGIFAIPAAKYPQFLKLTQDVDALIIKQSGGRVAAEKCRDRAVSYYDAKEYILAIKHLHRSKIHWFTSETLRGSLYSLLLISKCYENLKLTYAAKYYAAAAVYLIHINADDDLDDLLPQAFFRLAACCYSSGEWAMFVTVMHFALLAHINFDDSPLSLEKHEELSSLLSISCILRAITERYSPDLSSLIEDKISAWPMDQELSGELSELTQNKEGYWQRCSLEEFWNKSQEDLCGRPFCDLGSVRKIEWKALGIDWLVEFSNKHPETAIAEELVSMLQIIQADLVTHELALLPTRVKIMCEVADCVNVEVDELPDNKIMTWKIAFPRGYANHLSNSEDAERSIFSLASAILNTCSVLAAERFLKNIRMASKDGLFSKTFFVRPYTECYFQIMPETEFNAINRDLYQPLNSEQDFQIYEHKELCWRDDPGPGYSRGLAEKFLNNRYKESVKSIRLTLPRLLNSTEFKTKIKKLKEEGYLDWQILLLLMNIVLNYRMNILGGSTSDVKEYMRLSKSLIDKEEDDSSILVPVEAFTEEVIQMQKDIFAPTVSKTWGLIIGICQRSCRLNFLVG
jgi:hypothetical protein